MRSYLWVMLLAVMFLGFVAAQGFSQETVMDSQEEVTGSQEEMTEEEFVTEEWLLGDVVAVDLENSRLIVSYIDNETEEEKEISLLVDEATTYENAVSLDEIKVGNVVAIDYILEPDGKAVALNIRVEEPESDESDTMG